MTNGLEREFFTCPEVFAKELALIWNRRWIAVATIDDFGPDLARTDSNSGARFITTDLLGHSMILIRDLSGNVSGWHNTCRHRGTRLLEESKGGLKNDCITCPYHAWTYDLQGHLIGAPNMSGVNDFSPGDHGLIPVRVATWGGLIFVCLEPESESLSSFLDPLSSRLQNWTLDQLSLTHTLQYQVQANWKLIFQNYSECYHCPTVHPELNQQTPYRSATNDLEDGPILGGPMELAEGFETVSQDGQLVGDYLGHLDALQQRSIYYYTVFPNLFVSAHPDYVMLHRLIPESVNRTMVFCHFLAKVDASRESLSRAWMMWDNVNRQDWRVCELTQAGVQSPKFQPGPYSDLESMLMAFDRHYRTVMAEDG